QASAEQVTAYNRLGVATQNADGSLRDNIDVLKDIADAFKAMPDGANKSGLAMQLFGRAGQQAVPFLNEGSAAIDKLVAAGKKVAPGLSDAQIAIGKHLSDAFNVLDLAATRAKNSVLNAFAPATTKLVEGLTNFIAENRASWEALAEQIAQRVQPVIDAVLARLQSLSSDVNSDFILQTAQNFIQFGSD